MSRPRKHPLPESAPPADIAPETEAPKAEPENPEPSLPEVKKFPSWIPNALAVKALLLKGEKSPARTSRGDIDYDMIAWRLANWDAQDFVALYPESRLRQIGLQ